MWALRKTKERERELAELSAGNLGSETDERDLDLPEIPTGSLSLYSSSPRLPLLKVRSPHLRKRFREGHPFEVARKPALATRESVYSAERLLCQGPCCSLLLFLFRTRNPARPLFLPLSSLCSACFFVILLPSCARRSLTASLSFSLSPLFSILPYAAFVVAVAVHQVVAVHALPRPTYYAYSFLSTWRKSGFDSTVQYTVRRGTGFFDQFRGERERERERSASMIFRLDENER